MQEQQQTDCINDKDQKNADYITIYPNYKSICNNLSLNLTYLLGRGYYNLQKKFGLKRREIAECFNTTANNVTRALYVFHQLSPNLSDTASPTQAQTVRRVNACVPAVSDSELVSDDEEIENE